MIGNGIGFIVHENGFSCSNQVSMDKDIERIVEDGQKKSKHTLKLKFNCIFDGVGVLTPNLPVYCLYKDDEKDEQKAFTGLVESVTGKKVEILIKTNSDKIQEIKQKIQSWQHKLTY